MAKKSFRPPVLRRPTKVPEGSRLYRYGREPKVKTGGPGEPPPGFLSPTVSKSEWVAYWSLKRIYNPEEDPRKPPFNGGLPFWEYQSMEYGGRNLGGAVPDFVIHNTPSGRPILLRLQTERYHLFVTGQMHAYDALQKQRLLRDAEVVDIYEYAIVEDPTGAAAIKAIKNAIGLIELPNPLTAGTVRRIR